MRRLIPFFIILSAVTCGCVRRSNSTISDSSNSNTSTAIPASISVSLPSTFNRFFTGHLGVDQIEMRLVRQDNHLTGRVRYKGGGYELLDGKIDAQSNITLEQSESENNDPYIFWKGHFSSATQIEGEVSWKSPEPAKKFVLNQSEDLGAMRIDQASPRPQPMFQIIDISPDADPDGISEAARQAEAYWRKLLQKCGDSYYWAENRPNVGRAFTYQGNGEPTIEVNGNWYAARPLTEAEKLNKVDPQPIEWAGKTSVHFKVGRVAAGCSNCFDMSGFKWQDDYTFQRSMEKKKGRWEIIEDRSSSERLVRPTCSEVPK